MNIVLMQDSNVPIYEQIMRQVKQEIMSGGLETGEMLPSIRSLARDLQISVITTKRAYGELEKEGIIYAEAGKGFYVSKPDLQMLREQQLKDYEKSLGRLVEQGKRLGLTWKQHCEIVKMFYENNDI